MPRPFQQTRPHGRPTNGRRLYLPFVDAVAYAEIDAWRLTRWMASGSVEWAYHADGSILVQVDSLSDMAGVRVIHSRTLLAAAVLH